MQTPTFGFEMFWRIWLKMETARMRDKMMIMLWAVITDRLGGVK
jgi:hypothetical protein